MRKIALALALFGILAGSRPAPGATVAFVAPAMDPIRVAVLYNPGSGGNSAFDLAFSSLDIPGTSTRLTNPAAFNAMTPAQIRASYDVVVVTWTVDSSFDLNWTNRIRPYLALGGGVIWEDPTNVGDLSPGVIGSNVEGGGPYTFTVSVPGLTDGITGNFVNRHTAFSSWDPTVFNVFMVSGATTIGLYGQVPGGGRMVLTGPDQDFHSVRPSDQYSFLLNELRWAAPASVTPLRSQVQALITLGTLTNNYGALLMQILNSVQSRINQGRPASAISLLRSFISYVQKMPIPGPDKTSLTDAANALIARLAGS